MVGVGNVGGKSVGGNFIGGKSIGGKFMVGLEVTGGNVICGVLRGKWGLTKDEKCGIINFGEDVRMNKNAKRLKEIKEANKKEWKNMPEYKFTEQKPIRTIRINFKTVEDLKDFESLIGQKIYPKRNTYWYPERHDSLFSNLVYVDEKDES